jgi:hypothetical protein
VVVYVLVPLANNPTAKIKDCKKAMQEQILIQKFAFFLQESLAVNKE